MAERRALTRWQPFRELTSFERDMDRFFGDAFRWLDWPYLRRAPVIETGFMAPMEVFDRDGHTVVRLEVPGVRMDDIDISLVEGMLTIKGEKKHEEEIKEEECYCSERTYGRFHRTLSVPRGIDGSKISATYDNGVLEVTLPKPEEEKGHKITVKQGKAQ